MIDLGLVDEASAHAMACRISDLVRQHGELAVFVTHGRTVLVLPHLAAGYQQSLTRRVKTLVGRYVADIQCATSKKRSTAIREDIQERLSEIRDEARAA